MDRMVSFRKFVSMTMVMLVLLFMFQFTQVIKDVDNDYNVNEYATDSVYTNSSEWKKQTIQNVGSMQEYEFVAFLGDTDSQLGNIVSQWCDYTKRDLKEYASADELTELKQKKPEVLLIDSGFADFGKETHKFIALANEGIPMIFCNLPEVEVISKNGRLRELLGIGKVEEFNIGLSGVKLFGGFLLGGDTIYAVEEEEQAKRQDLDLEIPWYVVFNATKTYMVGMLEDDIVSEHFPEDYKYKNESMPAIIWRSSYKNAQIFTVNGDYMYDSTGLGILNAMMAELHTYELYPIINAQNLTVANFPGFAEENTETIMRLYSRDQSDLFRDIMWPSINATMKRNQLHESVFFMAQADYTDSIEPQADEYVFYLKELNEQKAEAGVSVNSRAKDISLADKMARDGEFYEEANDGYIFTAAYADDVTSTKQLRQIMKKETSLKGVKTIIQRYDATTPVVDYLDKDVTLQNTVTDGVYYTFSQDLRMKSLQTALGYSNTLLDMYPIAWPESPDDVWEKMYDDYSRNIDTFWRVFKVFDNTTASESDKRVRSFLSLDYESSKKDNVIELQVKNMQEEAWFILHTHNQEIQKTEGASFEKIEEDVYLLKISDANVKIHLHDITNLYYYMPE